MNVIGQDADRDGFERAALLDGSIDNSQSINLVHQQPARPVGENDCEEENAAFEFRSDVSWHQQSSCTKMVGTPRRAALPIYESAELFQHLSHTVAPVICPTGQIFVFVAMTNDVV